jgi:holin-like protein
MKYLFQLGIIFLVSLLGDFLSAALGLGIPGNVIGMLLMLGLLLSGVLKAPHIQETSDFLLKNMVLFFIPPIVDLIGVYGIIKEYIPAILVISLVTTIVTFYTTYLAVCLVTRLERTLRRKRA